ncbi:hypothetical protein [Legionella micdadei]|uniref:Uncharacterized protein n=1 Tax=Legionella micdadei TaxID=451 RepID=A0A098GHK9_LEGMI|nr:hypothetical protein [Legionella micdadei]KTD27545.1 hypothetical protein Lmic_1865 [Legionella micdadei]CEG60966.1 protein of unknown function [Legionella micdadei]SCY69669.1 hypothetical protein SAMN02982997_02537 [Legionella micdadei]
MAAEPLQLQAIFPDLPREVPVINKDGDFSPLWSLGLSSLFQALQENFSNEGILFPRLSATNIANIQTIYTPLIGSPLPQNIPDISGKTVFDTTNRVSKQFVITYDNANPPNIVAAQWNILSYLVLGSGNPNGAQAGQVSWFYYDLTGHALYICTTSGSTGGAVWTAI